MNNKKSVFATLIGKPNVGKSTLINKLIGEKIAITSRKPQTTRTRITGIITKGDLQYVIVDTPGFHKATTKLGDFMVSQTTSSIADVDIVVMVVDPFGKISDAEKELISKLKYLEMPAILVINKIDLLDDQNKLLDVISIWQSEYEFKAYIPISALKEKKVELVYDEIAKFAHEGPHYFSDDMMTDQSERVIVEEVIREKVLNYIHEEVPHGVGVVVERMRERKKNKGIMDIDATIYTEKNSHKGIIIGKKGESLGRIGKSAREELERFFNIKINLQLWVKVKEDWRNKETALRGIGYGDDFKIG